ncbi:MAG: hypothetical protein KKD48_03395 [Nanoarchaeota archaeon]|nr:hypothetical protein [Nanoarchaeota archaeon]
MNEKRFDIINYLPEEVISGKNNKKYILHKKEINNNLHLSYITDHGNNAKKEHILMLSRFISKSQETFEVLGLLQAEMGKTQNGCLVFANSEPKIINKILNWFEKEFDISKNDWKWYIAVNIKEDIDLNYKKEIENKLIDYWTKKTLLKIEQSHPKKVTYRKVKHTLLKDDYYGCLMIEFKNNLFSQIIKRFLNSAIYNMINENKENIKYFMRGVLAGEGTVESDLRCRKFRVHLSVTNLKEKALYVELFKLININAHNYPNDKVVVSKRKNNIELLNQRIMTLHPKKYAKFLNMMKNYPNIRKETNYFKGRGKNVWNKIPQEKINQILELYNSKITRVKDIAERVGVSIIKVNRVLKENNLGKRVIKTKESKRKEIAEFADIYKELSIGEIAKHFNTHRNVVQRSIQKYNIKRGNKSRCKIPEEKIQKIIELYKQNPAIKFSEISKKVGVSSSVIIRVRKEYNLGHLGYKYLIGCNNPNVNYQNTK